MSDLGLGFRVRFRVLDLGFGLAVSILVSDLGLGFRVRVLVCLGLAFWIAATTLGYDLGFRV